jgi:hypothetical protein
MNISTRARKISVITGWSYQKSRQAIVALGTRARDLAREKGWTLDRAEAYLIRPNEAAQTQTDPKKEIP